jgi:hypothetical protein
MPSTGSAWKTRRSRRRWRRDPGTARSPPG